MSLDKVEQMVRTRIRKTDPDLADSPFVDAAIYQILKEQSPGDDADTLVVRAVQRTRTLQEEQRAIELRQTATDRIFGDALVRVIAPVVEELRRDGFGGLEPPFGSVGEAAEWIRAQGAEDLREWRATSTERDAASREIDRLAVKYLIEITFNSTVLPHQVPGDEHAKNASVLPTTFLYRLAKETGRLARYTGLPQYALVTHVLTGLKPIRSRARITTRRKHYTLPSGEQLHVNEAEVLFRARDLTDKEHRGVYRMVKGSVGGSGTQALNERDEHLWGLVQDRGGPPQTRGKKGLFWQAILEDFDREFPGEIATRRGIEMRYARIMERLQDPPEA